MSELQEATLPSNVDLCDSQILSSNPELQQARERSSSIPQVETLVSNTSELQETTPSNTTDPCDSQIISNPTEFIDVFSTRGKKFNTLRTDDFTKMYTKIPHDDLMKELEFAVDVAFSHLATKFEIQPETAKAVLKYVPTQTAQWTEGGSSRFSRDWLLRSLHTIFSNAYFSNNGKVYLQVFGIPMGVEPGPPIANLYLFAKEYKWVTKQVEELGEEKVIKDFDGFNFVLRYIDDRIAADIPASELPTSRDYGLEIVETGVGNDIVFLGIRGQITDAGCLHFKSRDKANAFDFKVIRYPTWDSNLPEHIRIGCVIGGLVRVFTFTSLYRTCVEESRAFLAEFIREKGYREKTMRSGLTKFCHRHLHPRLRSQFIKDMQPVMIGFFKPPPPEQRSSTVDNAEVNINDTELQQTHEESSSVPQVETLVPTMSELQEATLPSNVDLCDSQILSSNPELQQARERSSSIPQVETLVSNTSELQETTPSSTTDPCDSQICVVEADVSLLSEQQASAPLLPEPAQEGNNMQQPTADLVYQQTAPVLVPFSQSEIQDQCQHITYINHTHVYGNVVVEPSFTDISQTIMSQPTYVDASQYNSRIDVSERSVHVNVDLGGVPEFAVDVNDHCNNDAVMTGVPIQLPCNSEDSHDAVHLSNDLNANESCHSEVIAVSPRKRSRGPVIEEVYSDDEQPMWLPGPSNEIEAPLLVEEIVPERLQGPSNQLEVTSVSERVSEARSSPILQIDMSCRPPSPLKIMGPPLETNETAQSDVENADQKPSVTEDSVRTTNSSDDLSKPDSKGETSKRELNVCRKRNLPFKIQDHTLSLKPGSYYFVVTRNKRNQQSPPKKFYGQCVSFDKQFQEVTLRLTIADPKKSSKSSIDGDIRLPLPGHHFSRIEELSRDQCLEILEKGISPSSDDE